MDIDLNIWNIIEDKIKRQLAETDKKYILVNWIKSHIFWKWKFLHKCNYKFRLWYTKSDLASRKELDELMRIKHDARSMNLHYKMYWVALDLSGDVVCSDWVYSCFSSEQSLYFSCNTEAKRKANTYLFKRKDGT